MDFFYIYFVLLLVCYLKNVLQFSSVSDWIAKINIVDEVGGEEEDVQHSPTSPFSLF